MSELTSRPCLVLLQIDDEDGPIYFVLNTSALYDPTDTHEEWQDHLRYFYEQHTCPTNFIRDNVIAIYADGDDDPHGIFGFVRAEWVTDEYKAAEKAHDTKAYLERLFPEIITKKDGLVPPKWPIGF